MSKLRLQSWLLQQQNNFGAVRRGNLMGVLYDL